MIDEWHNTRLPTFVVYDLRRDRPSRYDAAAPSARELAAEQSRGKATRNSDPGAGTTPC